MNAIEGGEMALTPPFENVRGRNRVGGEEEILVAETECERKVRYEFLILRQILTRDTGAKLSLLVSEHIILTTRN